MILVYNNVTCLILCITIFTSSLFQTFQCLLRESGESFLILLFAAIGILSQYNPFPSLSSLNPVNSKHLSE